MNEDNEIMCFLKEKLETDVPREPPRMSEIMRTASTATAARAAARRSRRWAWGTSLAAASLAFVCCMTVVSLKTERPSPESTVAAVIDILCAVDGVDSAAEGSSVADRLLAWQDAPYRTAVSELLSGEGDM